MARAARLLQVGAVAALAVAYACLAHYTNASGSRAAGAALALAPLGVAALAACARAGWRGLPFALALAGGIAWLWPWMMSHYGMLYWIEHAGTQCLIGYAFARSLAPGREPLCSRFARMVHGALEPAVAAYTRALTRVWALFSFGMAFVSTALYLAAPLRVWSLFANFITGPLIVLMFVGEYLLRRRLLPHVEHAGILAGIEAYRASPGVAREH
jgi:uncharacterized membrane protein